MKVGEMSFQCSLVVHMMAQTDSSTQYHSMFSQRSDRASSSMTVLLIHDINLADGSSIHSEGNSAKCSRQQYLCNLPHDFM
jgi:hypothetical protein